MTWSEAYGLLRVWIFFFVLWKAVSYYYRNEFGRSTFWMLAWLGIALSDR